MEKVFDGVNDFMVHLNSNMDKPDNYFYDLKTRIQDLSESDINTRQKRPSMK